MLLFLLVLQLPTPCRAPPQACRLAVADSMAQVTRDWRPGSDAPNVLRVSLAQGESENVQLVVVGPCDVARAEAKLAPVAGSSAGAARTPTVQLHPLGWVAPGPCPATWWGGDSRARCPGAAPYKCRDGTCANASELRHCPGCSQLGPPPGLPPRPSWPLVLLPLSWRGGGFMVPANQSQPLVVAVHAPADLGPGNHTGLVRIITADGGRLALDLRVDVHDFVLPPHSLPALFGLREEFAARFGWSVDGYVDFLLEHRIPISSRLHGAAAWPSIGSNRSALAGLWRRGQRTWMLASWAQPSSSCPGSPCANCTATDCASGAKSPALVAAFLDDIAAALRAAQAAGWPANATSVYIGDEIKTSEVWAVGQVAQAVSAAFPDVQVVSCGIAQFVCASGFAPDGSPQPLPGCPAAMRHVDLLLPRAIYYSNYSSIGNARTLDGVRAGGTRVGWYTSGVPTGAGALNFFTELSPMRARLLAGVGTVKAGAEALLYYRLDGFEGYVAAGSDGRDARWQPLLPVYTTPTLEVADFSQGGDEDYDGEGMLIVPSSDGPLSTIHLEGLRDGLEDHSYFALLAGLVAEAEAAGMDVRAERRELRVEDAVFKRMQPEPDPTEVGDAFATEPAVLRQKRRAVAAAILSVRRKLRRSKTDDE